jgi:hypothetical protein
VSAKHSTSCANCHSKFHSPLAKEIAARPVSTLLGLQILEGKEGQEKLLTGYKKEEKQKPKSAGKSGDMAALERRLQELRQQEHAGQLTSAQASAIREEKAAVKKEIKAN